MLTTCIACLMTSCATHTGTGTLAGAGIGAAAGSAVGKDKKHTLGGALLGAAFGATVGAIFDANDKKSKQVQSTPANTHSRRTAQRPPAPRTHPPLQPQRSAWPASRAPASRAPQPTPRQQPAPPRIEPSNYPVATRTEEHGIVISPHAPNKKVNVRNFPSGSVVVDPNSNKRFRVP